MPHFRLFLKPIALLAAVAMPLSGCILNSPPMRGGVDAQKPPPKEVALNLQATGPATAAVPLKVQEVLVTVPRSLKVSEVNSIKPVAEIVWHGDEKGDRYAQVQKITQEAMNAGVRPYRSGPPVVIEVQVTRFHALTPITRKTIGGMHELEYSLTLRDADSGKVLRHVDRVDATVRGAGGLRARAEEAEGRTEKVVIEEALAASIQKELGLTGQAMAQMDVVAQAAGTPVLAPLH